MLCRTTTRQRRQLAVQPPRRPLTSDAVDRLTAVAPRSTRQLGDVIGEKGGGAPVRTASACGEVNNIFSRSV